MPNVTGQVAPYFELTVTDDLGAEDSGTGYFLAAPDTTNAGGDGATTGGDAGGGSTGVSGGGCLPGLGGGNLLLFYSLYAVGLGSWKLGRRGKRG